MACSDLTVKQAECLTAIRDITAAQGYPPTIGELGAYLNVGPTTASLHINSLRKKGYVAPRVGGTMRQTRLTDKGTALFKEG